MKQLLRAAQFEGSNWFDALPHAEMAINNAPILNSDYSAYYLNYGFHTCCEADLFGLHAQQHNAVEHVDELLSRMHSDWNSAYNLMIDLQDDLRFRENARRHAAAKLLPGDLVIVNVRRHASILPNAK